MQAGLACLFRGPSLKGHAFAGAAAGLSLGSMYWNPATMTQTPGRNFEADGTGLFANVNQHASSASTLVPFGLDGANDTVHPALIPSAYMSSQVNPNYWLGLSVNSPYGLSVNFPDQWAGRTYGLSTSLVTFDITPSIAIKVNEWLSLGFGAQIQYARANLNIGIGAAPGSQVNISGNGWGYGFTAGLTVTPGPNTTIGVGWRSAVDQRIDGGLNLDAIVPFSTPGSVNTTVALPDIVDLGVKHQLNDRWGLLGTVEWTNWSRIGTSAFTQATGGVALIGGSPVTLPFQYRDGWFYSIGAEYVWDARTTLRGGLGYELSPVTDRVRIPLVPDNDRFWLSAGLSVKISPDLILDVGYDHLFVKDASINITAGSGNPSFNPASGIAYVGDVTTSVNVFSIGLRYMFDRPRRAIVTKG
jgi:long-chain fatty acid transport protein